MSSRPLVLCLVPSTSPLPMMLELAERSFKDDFILIHGVKVVDLSQNEREKVKGIICNHGFRRSKMRVNREIMDLLPNLKVISTPSAGVDHIDVEEATARGIRVGHVPGYFNSDSVAEFAVGLLLASARSILQANEVAKSSDAAQSANISRWIPPSQVTGSTLGLVGFGNIGRAIAERAKGFKMNILYHCRTRKEELEIYSGATFCLELKELLTASDFVVLSLPLTPETTDFISAEELSIMKSTATLINVGRGETVNHDDLTVALQKGVIKAAALDVTDPPVLPRDHPLLNMSNVIITPHIAYLTTNVQQLHCWTSLDNLKAGVKDEELLYSVN